MGMSSVSTRAVPGCAYVPAAWLAETLQPSHLLPQPALSYLAFTCHFNLLPIKASLRSSSCSCMLRVVKLALLVCASIYSTVVTSGEKLG